MFVSSVNTTRITPSASPKDNPAWRQAIKTLNFGVIRGGNFLRREMGLYVLNMHGTAQRKERTQRNLQRGDGKKKERKTKDIRK
jgi:hypothetical protein